MELDFLTLKRLISEKNISELKKVLSEYNNVNIAHLLEEMDTELVTYFLGVCSEEDLGEIFSYLTHVKQAEVLRYFKVEDIKTVFENLYTDDIVYFLEELAEDEQEKYLLLIPEERRNLIERILTYPLDFAGSIMNPDFVELGQYNSVEEALEIIKTSQRKEYLDYCFILDYKDRILGYVSIKEVLLAERETLISDLMLDDIITVRTSDDQETVAKIMMKYDIEVVPVLDEGKHMVGIITADDIIDVIEAEATEDIHKMHAVGDLDDSYLVASPLKIAISRLPWILILLVVYSLSSLVMYANSDLIVLFPALIIYMPMLMDTTGDAGSQALAMVVRGIAVDDLGVKDFLEVMWKEFRVAILTGAVLFIANMLRLYYFSGNSGDWGFALVVSLSLYIVVIIAKLVGGLLPILALIFKVDPAAMASPLITTVCDSLSLIIYFGLAKVIL